MCVLINDLAEPVLNFSILSVRPGIAQTAKIAHPPTPPHFAMYMQTKDLQRSVGDRYASKGLKGKLTSTFQHSAPAHGVIPSCEGPAFAFRIWFYLSLRTLRLCVQRLYLRRFLLFFRSPKTAL
jgi:hypothetical protein